MTSVLDRGVVVVELRYFKVIEIEQNSHSVYLVCQAWNSRVVEAINDKAEAFDFAETENARLSDDSGSDELTD